MHSMADSKGMFIPMFLFAEEQLISLEHFPSGNVI